MNVVYLVTFTPAGPSNSLYEDMTAIFSTMANAKNYMFREILRLKDDKDYDLTVDSDDWVRCYFNNSYANEMVKCDIVEFEVDDECEAF